MVTLEDDTLAFRFPEFGDEASARIRFLRTLRIPDDGREHMLPAGLGTFPVRHVDDYASRLPEHIVRRGGVLVPMYQAEALWIDFGGYWPMAVQVGTGKICAVTGSAWREELAQDPEQNYLTVPTQPWLDGYAVEKGVVRQFVAMPLGRGVTVEEQKTGSGEWGGMQLRAVPLREEVWRREQAPSDAIACYSVADVRERALMGFAPGGKIRQQIYEDPRPLSDWDPSRSARVFVHLLNSLDWRRITGEAPPSTPVSREAYVRHGIPWFDHYREDVGELPGGKGLQGARSTGETGSTVDVTPPSGFVEPNGARVVQTGPHRRPRTVREGEF